MKNRRSRMIKSYNTLESMHLDSLTLKSMGWLVADHWANLESDKLIYCVEYKKF